MIMKEYKAELFIEPKCELAEGPVYDGENDILYWNDIQANRIFRMPMNQVGKWSYKQIDRHIGSLVFTDKNNILAGLDDGVYMFDNEKYGIDCTLGSGYEPYCVMKEYKDPAVKFNDGKCDPAGRYIVGSQGQRDGVYLGHLYSVSARDTFTVLADEINCSNGLAWSADGTKLFYVDTRFKHKSYISVFDYDVETGAATNRRPLVEYDSPATGVGPDGMTIDSEGNLWVAEWAGYGISGYSSKTGEKIGRIELPAARVSCCCFGGKDYKTLFITTAEGPGEHGGDLFTAQMDIPGLPAVKFKE